ncbi:MAG: hypothetical protein HY017_12455 [Betaproteobacteria bacterium]|nr:hypothetical protein [Betaproteobacteria bacterium]
MALNVLVLRQDYRFDREFFELARDLHRESRGTTPRIAGHVAGKYPVRIELKDYEPNFEGGLSGKPYNPT